MDLTNSHNYFVKWVVMLLCVARALSTRTNKVVHHWKRALGRKYMISQQLVLEDDTQQ